MSGVEKLISLDVLPSLVDPVWDTSRVLDDSGRIGGLIASFTGYRSRPGLLPLLVLAAYWGTVWATLFRGSRKAAVAPKRAPVAPPVTRAGH